MKTHLIVATAAAAFIAIVPLRATEIVAIDGDTVVVRDGSAPPLHVRLVGFDTPERAARCPAEAALAEAAAVRLRDLLAGSSIDLRLVPCACRPGTEGTPRCNYGRACGVLRAGGVDVGVTLIAEGLARPYVCTGGRCPRRAGWCNGRTTPE